VAASLLVAGLAESGLAADSARRTVLDEYIAAPDASYRFQLVKEIPAEGVKAYLLEMTSQTWGLAAEVDRTEWKHWLTIYKPARVDHATGLLMIGSGNNDGRVPEKGRPELSRIAEATHSVVAELRMAPNQPLTFLGDGHGPRVEDEILAEGWRRYLDTGETRWLFHLPMTKSAVRAMDTVTAFLASEEGGGVAVGRFVVAGASKRGWTAWLTAAVDDRVAGVAPIVIDLPNVKPSFLHHYRVYGFWAPAVKDYFRAGIMDRMHEPGFERLMAVLDPFAYRERFTMPKFLVNSAGDQFFLPDSSQFYFDDLLGEKHIRYVPNSDHSLRNTDAIESITAFYHGLLNGAARPRFSWSFADDGSIRVETEDPPLEVRLWRATNPRHRDFRLESAGPIYKSEDLQQDESVAASAGASGSPSARTYIGRVQQPEEGWTAFFVELTYPSGLEKYPFKFTTGVRVTPGTYPHGEPVPGQTRVGPQKQ
jgi:PhoPQ-activated pathogenicity-related protein